MTIKVKSGGAYNDGSVFSKVNGVYLAVSAVYAKVGGAYQIVSATPVPIPSGFTYTPPFSVFREGTAGAYTFRTTYNPESKKPTPTSTVYVGLGGNNNNDGLTYATRVRSFSLAIAMANAIGGTVRILFEAGTYLYTNTQARSGQPSLNATYPDNWANITAGTPTCDLVIEPYDGTSRAELIFNKNVTWNATSDANIWVTNAMGASNVGFAVADSKFLDPEGQPTGLFSVFTVADTANPWPEINAAWDIYSPLGLGVRYYHGASQKMYVRLKDNRQPDSQVRCHDSGQLPGWAVDATGNRIIWMKNMTFRGGSAAFQVKASGTNGFTVNFYATDCYFTHSGGYNGQTAAFLQNDGGGELIHYRSISSYHADDAFAYYSGGGGNPTIVEIDCISRYAGLGQTSLTVNGSTTHGSCVIMRVNGKYYNALDSAINDINSTLSWNLGVEASNRRGPSGGESSVCFRSGFPGVTASPRMWLDGCRAVDGALGAANYKTTAYTNAILYYANMDFVPTATPGTGSIQTYTA